MPAPKMLLPNEVPVVSLGLLALGAADPNLNSPEVPEDDDEPNAVLVLSPNPEDPNDGACC